MVDPIFWLGLSLLLVAFSLTVFLIAALPALQEIARAARSIEKLIDTLRRELPPTLEAIRLTGLEITDLTDDVNAGVKSASQVVKQVDQSLDSAKKQAQKVQVTTKSVVLGIKAAWNSLLHAPSSRRSDAAGGSRLRSMVEQSDRRSSQRRTRSLRQNADETRFVEPPNYRDRSEDLHQPTDNTSHFQPNEDFEPSDTE